jgi:hypothetical protein
MVLSKLNPAVEDLIDATMLQDFTKKLPHPPILQFLSDREPRMPMSQLSEKLATQSNLPNKPKNKG